MVVIGTTRPYGHTGLADTNAWFEHGRLEWVRWKDVTTTQDGVYIAAVVTRTHVADPFPHVVVYQHRLYLEDGHTRMCRSILSGESGTTCRVFHVT